jgi:hypothetical protein
MQYLGDLKTFEDGVMKAVDFVSAETKLKSLLGELKKEYEEWLKWLPDAIDRVKVQT